MKLRLPYYEAVRDGLKTVEGRPGDGSFATLSIGNIIEFSLDGEPDAPKIYKKISLIERFCSFSEMIKAVGRDNCLPGMFDNDESAVALYHSFPNYEQRAEQFGVLAIHLSSI